jgi:hypothetical protein
MANAERDADILLRSALHPCGRLCHKVSIAATIGRRQRRVISHSYDAGEYSAEHSSLRCVLTDLPAERLQHLAEMTGIQLFAVLDTRRKATGRSLRTHSRTSTVPNNQPTRREAATMRYRLLAACRSQPTARGIVELSRPGAARCVAILRRQVCGQLHVVAA